MMQLNTVLESIPRLEQLDELTSQYFTEDDGDTLSPEAFYRLMIEMKHSLKDQFGKHDVQSEMLTELQAMRKKQLITLAEVGFQACQVYQLDGEIRYQARVEQLSTRQV